MAKHIPSIKNSSVIPLLANNTFNGDYEETTPFHSITILICSDADSQNGGLTAYYSNDKSIILFMDRYTYIKNVTSEFNLQIKTRYFKLSYTNGLTNQTKFTLNTIYDQSIKYSLLCKFSEKHTDTFNRLKISTPVSILGVKHIYSNNILQEDEYSSSNGLIVYNNMLNNGDASVTLNVTSINNHVIRQSRMYCNYQPGKTLEITMTGVLNNGNNDNSIISRIGYFDHSNGVFFERSNGTVYIVLRNNNTDYAGTYLLNDTKDTRIPQSNWNIDKLDGNGISGITIDFTKALIFYIEFSWLGVGIIRYGIYYAGILYFVHTFFNHDITKPYMQTPNLPVRYEIATTATSGSPSGSLKQICYTVANEIEKTLNGQLFSTTSAVLSTNSYDGIRISKSTTNESYVMSIKLKAFERKIIKLRNVSINCITSANIIYKLYLVRNSGFTIPPFSGSLPTYNDVHPQSSANVAIGNGSTTTNILVSGITNNNNWIPVCTGSFNTNTNIDCREFGTDTNLFLSAGIQTGANAENFNSDHFVLTCIVINTGGNNNETVIASFTWIEY